MPKKHTVDPRLVKYINKLIKNRPIHCWSCRKKGLLPEPYGWTCPHCGAEIRICNCCAICRPVKKDYGFGPYNSLILPDEDCNKIKALLKRIEQERNRKRKR